MNEISSMLSLTRIAETCIPLGEGRGDICTKDKVAGTFEGESRRAGAIALLCWLWYPVLLSSTRRSGVHCSIGANDELDFQNVLLERICVIHPKLLPYNILAFRRLGFCGDEYDTLGVFENHMFKSQSLRHILS